MYYIKCKDCGKIMGNFETNLQFEGESGFYCKECYAEEQAKREEENTVNRIRMFFEMFVFLTLALLIMCTVLLFIPMFGIWLGVPEWGGLIYAFFILIVGASITYSLS